VPTCDAFTTSRRQRNVATSWQLQVQPTQLLCSCCSPQIRRSNGARDTDRLSRACTVSNTMHRSSTCPAKQGIKSSNSQSVCLLMKQPDGHRTADHILALRLNSVQDCLCQHPCYPVTARCNLGIHHPNRSISTTTSRAQHTFADDIRAHMQLLPAAPAATKLQCIT
jgi:hypothetical protein